MRGFITAACAFLEIDPPQVLNRGLHLDLEVLQWSKLVEIWGAQNEAKNNPQFALHLRTAAAPHRKLQPAKLRDARDGVCEGVARRQS